MAGYKAGNWRKDTNQTRAFMRIDLTDMLRDYKNRSWKLPCPCGQGTFVVQDQEAQSFKEKENLLLCHGCRRYVFLDVPTTTTTAIASNHPPRTVARREVGHYYYYGH